MRIGRWLAALALVGLLAPTAQAAERCFPETEHCLTEPFASYWAQNGGLPVFGFPISAVNDEYNPDTDAVHPTQWLERNRFERHAENAGTPYEILLGLLGKEALETQGRDWQSEPRESGPKAGCLWFEETGHNVCDQAPGAGFKTYWENNGLNVPGLNRYARSLQLFGLPLTEPKIETNSSGDTVLTQWFERARFEWHPDNPAQFRVLLGLLGKEVRSSLPTSEPAGAVSGLGVINQSLQRSSRGNVYVLGEVRNDSAVNVARISVKARFYDAEGGLLDTRRTYATRGVLAPGERSPFLLAHLSPPAGISSVAFEVTAHEVLAAPVSGVTIADYRLEPTTSALRELKGEVRNESGAAARLVRVVATGYDANGAVVAQGSSLVRSAELAPGATAAFTVQTIEWRPVARYELVAEAFRP